jgi:hypothetical protein
MNKIPYLVHDERFSPMRLFEVLAIEEFHHQHRGASR